MIVLVEHNSHWCCVNCKSGACIRVACAGDDCHCAAEGQWHGHADPETVYANWREKMMLTMPPMDMPPGDA